MPLAVRQERPVEAPRAKRAVTRPAAMRTRMHGGTAASNRRALATVSVPRTASGLRNLAVARPIRRQMIRATVGIVAQPASTPQLRVVPQRRRAARLVAVGFGVVFVLMLGAAAFQTQLARRQVQLDKIDRSIRDAQQSYGRLRRQSSELRAPARLVDEASKLGMVPAQSTTFVAIDPSIVALVQQSSGGVFDNTAGSDGSTLDEYMRVKAATVGAP